MNSIDLSHRPEAVEPKRIVIDITRMTVHNGPGIRTVIAFKGCPLRCDWCSTPESQREAAELTVYAEKCILCGDCIPVCPNDAITADDVAVSVDRILCDDCGQCVSVCNAEALKLAGKEYTVDQLVAEVKKDAVIYKHSAGGVTVSGGEPFFRPEFLLALLRTLKANGISAGIDTCGFTAKKNVESVLPYVDFFLWDIKHMDREKHLEYTGVSNEPILQNLRFVSENAIPVYLRLPLIPGFNDSVDNLLDVCNYARSLDSLVEIDLLPLHHLGKARYAALGRVYPIDGIPLIEEDSLLEMKRLVESTGIKCTIIG